MKKILVLAVAMMMLLCSAALAEEELTINPEDVTVNVDKSLDAPLELTAIDYAAKEFGKELAAPIELDAAESFAAGKADSVIRDGSKYIVSNGTMKFTLDMTKYSAILCFTQDKMASFESYLRISDPNGLQGWLVENAVNYYLYDTETKMEAYIYMDDQDALTQMVGNFSVLSDANKQKVASMLSNNAEIKKAGSTSWIKIKDTLMLTIAKDHYVITEFGGSGDPGNDLLDTLDILSYLTIE